MLYIQVKSIFESVAAFAECAVYSFSSRISFFIYAFLLMGLIACDEAPSDDIVHINKDVYTAEEQNTFGENLHENIMASDAFTTLDPVEYANLYDHLETTFKTLSQTTLIENRDIFNWEVTILKDDNERMAFCGPGGHFYIYTGLLKYLSGEHELVALMAHEIYYANTGKAMTALQAKFNGDPFLLGDIFLGYQIPEAEEVALYMAHHIYGSEDVMEADDFSLEVVCPFQYNPAGLKTLLQRAIQTANLDWLHRRPGSSNRMQLLAEGELDCGNVEEDPTFSERYQELIKNLP